MCIESLRDVVVSLHTRLDFVFVEYNLIHVLMLGGIQSWIYRTKQV